MVKNLPTNAEDTEDAGSLHGLGIIPRGGNGKLLQYSCLEQTRIPHTEDHGGLQSMRLQSIGHG